MIKTFCKMIETPVLAGVCLPALLLCSTACSEQTPFRAANPGGAPAATADSGWKIDRKLAWDHLMKNGSFGARPSGSAANRKAIAWIAEEAGSSRRAEVKLMGFTEQTPAGIKEFNNLIVDLPGPSRDFVIVGAHHDTKMFTSFDKPFIGANDGASGVAAMLAMIQTLSARKEPLPIGVRFLFFDGEECQYEYGENDGLHGSRAYAARLAKSPELPHCRAVILLDMIGDADLKIQISADTDSGLRKLLREAAEEIGTQNHFTDYPGSFLDDHVPFQKIGIPAVDLIDFQYGKKNLYWHTPADTPDKLSAESLGIAADTALALIRKIAEKK